MREGSCGNAVEMSTPGRGSWNSCVCVCVDVRMDVRVLGQQGRGLAGEPQGIADRRWRLAMTRGDDAPR